MIKRLFDFFTSISVLLLLFPVLLFIAWRVRCNFGLPIIFRQTRPGMLGKSFVMLKFRTMTDERDAEGKLLSDDERLTKFGRWLRATSLDELPELLNVLRGDMSLVGPRPLLMEYLPLYSSEQFRRHEARPGITGWAQVNGRNMIDWENRLAMDVWYVDNKSFFLDIKILLLTVKKVFSREGINFNDHITMEKFKGKI